MRYFGICIHLFVFIPSVITLQLKMSERQDCRFIRRKGDFMNNNQTSAVNNTANKTFTTKYMVELAAMIAIIIIMAFTPLGLIPESNGKRMNLRQDLTRLSMNCGRTKGFYTTAMICGRLQGVIP